MEDIGTKEWLLKHVSSISHNSIHFVIANISDDLNIKGIVVPHVQNALYFWLKVRALKRTLLCERTSRFSRFLFLPVALYNSTTSSVTN